MREIRTYGSVGALGVASHPGPPDSRVLYYLLMPPGRTEGLNSEQLAALLWQDGAQSLVSSPTGLSTPAK